jgi:hypothetical protein
MDGVEVIRQPKRGARFFVWLLAALVASGIATGVTLGTLAGAGKGSAHKSSTAVLGVQIGGPNATSGATNTPKSFGLSGIVTGLYPGRTLNLPVLVTNQNNQAIKVTQIKITVTATNKTGCAPSSTNLIPTNYVGPGFTVPKNSTRTILLPITMPHGAVNACQGATFTLKYAGQAVKP